MTTIDTFSRHLPSPSSWHIPVPSDAPRGSASARNSAAQPSARAARNILNTVQVDEANDVVKFCAAEPRGSQTPAVLRAGHPIPADCLVYMLEVHVLSMSRSPDASCKIALGLQFTDTLLARLPGQERNSVGVHSDAGVYAPGAGVQPYVSFGSGDTISFVVNCKAETLICAKNGINMGEASVMINRHRSLYPCIGFEGGEASVTVNFGAKPFRYTALLEHEREQLHRQHAKSVQRTHSKSAQQLSDAGMQAVLAHLDHACCWRTTQALQRALAASRPDAAEHLMQPAGSIEAMQRRKQVMQLVMQGKVTEAREAVEQQLAESLGDQAELRFELRLQEFIEMQRRDADENAQSDNTGTATQLEAIHFAREHLQPDSAPNKSLRTRCLEVLTLLAYKRPSESPVAHLFDQSMRQRCADVVNAALTRSQRHANHTTLELLHRQIGAVHSELRHRSPLNAQLMDHATHTAQVTPPAIEGDLTRGEQHMHEDEG